LIHKAVPLSGNTIQALDQEYSKGLGAYVLKEAGLKPAEIDRLQDIPWKDYILIANRAAQKYAQDNPRTGMMRGGFGPVGDGVNLPEGQFFADPEGLSSDVPMIISSTFHEWSMSRTNPALEEITADSAKAMLAVRAGFSGGFGDRAGEIYDAYAEAFPEAKPIEIVTLIGSNRKNVINTANAKAAQAAPVYVDWFGWQPPMFNGRMRAFHCLDICFWFYNTDLMLTHTGGGARPGALSDKMSGALLQFMRTGDPNGGGLPQWPPYTVENGETMILDDVCVVKNDPDREARSHIPD